MKKLGLLVLSFLFIFGSVKADACLINISVKNTGKDMIYFINFSNYDLTAVKTKGGFWRSLWNGGWMDNFNSAHIYLDTRESMADHYDATLSCLHDRRYVLTYRCFTGPLAEKTFTKYIPSANGWTKSKDINFELDGCQ